ncbi:MAG: hypothetical protein ACPL7R_07800, partial [Anaerolineae bacterium]
MDWFARWQVPLEPDEAFLAVWRDSRLESVRVLATADFATPETAVEYYLASLGLAAGSVEAACL